MSLPIPSDLWKRIEEFCQGQRTGQITLNFHEGRIESFDIREHARIKAQNSLDKSRITLVECKP